MTAKEWPTDTTAVALLAQAQELLGEAHERGGVAAQAGVAAQLALAAAQHEANDIARAQTLLDAAQHLEPSGTSGHERDALVSEAVALLRRGSRRV